MNSFNASRPFCSRGFTLVELLVVIAIMALLVNLLLPSMSAAKKVARQSVCAANLKQQGIMVGQYAADTKDFIPQPTTGHGLINKNFVGASACMMTSTGPTGALTCPEYAVSPYATYRLMPTGMGWFYYQGYLNPVVKKARLGILSCPDQPYIGRYRGTYIDGIDSGVAGQGYSAVTDSWFTAHTYAGLATGLSMASASYDCLSNVMLTDYAYRGWALKAISTPTPRYSAWNSNNAYAVDREQHDFSVSTIPTSVQDADYWSVHGADGVNIMFIDGHVIFGGRNMNDDLHGYGVVPPFVYYNLKYYYPGYSISADWGIGGGGASSGYTGGGNSNAFIALWTYYETGIK